MFWSVVILGIACNCGEMVSNRFEIIHDALCRCDWYLWPIDLQQIILIVLANTQRSTIVYGFGNVECSRESFKKVKLGVAPYQYQYHFQSDFVF